MKKPQDKLLNAYGNHGVSISEAVLYPSRLRPVTELIRLLSSG